LSEIRIDRVKLGKVSKTPEGYLRGDAIVTRTGVFKYINLDGTERLELRAPEDILQPDSLATLKSLPITNDHPTTLVTAENAAQLTVGMTGETVMVEDGYVGVSLNITHKNAIDAINGGKQELSAGYRVDLVPEVGEYNGERYTHRQTNVIYNHLAIVEMGRAGRMARLNLDGAFIQCDEVTKNEEKEIMTTNNENNNGLLDVVETIAETVVQATTGVDLHTVHTTAEKVVAGVEQVVNALENGEATTETETNTDEVDEIIKKLKAENEELKQINADSLIAEKAKQRVVLLSKAAAFMNTDGLLDKSEREIMMSVINSRAMKNFDFADKSDDYVLGRFDAVLEEAEYRHIKRQMNNLDEKPQEKKINSVFEMMKSQHRQYEGVA
jgi:hypothetical protein